jgi:hypothetical protein
MSRKKKIGLYDIGRLPVTEVGNKSGFQTRKEFYNEQEQIAAREQAAAEERLMAPVRAAEHDMQTAAREHSGRIARFWQNPLPLVAECGIELAPNELAGDYPLQEGPRDKKAEIAAYEKCKSDLASRGCIISQEGWNRVGGYLEALQYHRNVSLSAVESWTLAIERLFHLSCFADGEISGYDNAVAARKAKKQPRVETSATPTWSAVQDLNPENREQKRLIERALGEDFTSEVAAFFGLWLDQLYRDYQYYMPEPIIKRALAYVTSANLNPLRHETWNIVRRNFTKNGWMRKADGSLMMTEREKLSDFCDTADLNDREVRRQINLKNRELLESEPAFAPHK